MDKQVNQRVSYEIKFIFIKFATEFCGNFYPAGEKFPTGVLIMVKLKFITQIQDIWFYQRYNFKRSICS